jgi:hypothetical protein
MSQIQVAAEKGWFGSTGFEKRTSAAEAGLRIKDLRYS